MIGGQHLVFEVPLKSCIYPIELTDFTFLLLEYKQYYRLSGCFAPIFYFNCERVFTFAYISLCNNFKTKKNLADFIKNVVDF